MNSISTKCVSSKKLDWWSIKITNRYLLETRKCFTPSLQILCIPSPNNWTSCWSRSFRTSDHRSIIINFREWSGVRGACFSTGRLCRWPSLILIHQRRVLLSHVLQPHRILPLYIPNTLHSGNL